MTDVINLRGFGGKNPLRVRGVPPSGHADGAVSVGGPCHFFTPLEPVWSSTSEAAQGKTYQVGVALQYSNQKPRTQGYEITTLLGALYLGCTSR